MSLDCYCDWDPATFYRAEMRTARKTYRCEECPAEIRPGDRYEYVCGMWEGDISIFRTCVRCIGIRQWVKNNIPCLCWTHGNTLQDCRDAVDEASWRAPEETRGLRFGLLRRLVLAERARPTEASG